MKPDIIRYFRLRPAQGWSSLFFTAAIILLFAVKWSNSINTDDYTDLTQFQMIELEIPETISEPDIAFEEPEEEEVAKEEEKPLKFGDDSKFGDMSNTAIPPKPRLYAVPRYPESMRKAGIEGVVEIELGIDESGKIVYGRIVRSLGKAFDEVVISWAKTIKFWPAMDPDRNPIKCKIRLPVRFKLEM